MGLDTVELVMAIEEEFVLTVPNATAETLVTVGDLHDFVISTLRQRGEALDEIHVWERLRHVIVRQLGVKPEEVVPRAHIVYDLHAD